ACAEFSHSMDVQTCSIVCIVSRVICKVAVLDRLLEVATSRIQHARQRGERLLEIEIQVDRVGGGDGVGAAAGQGGPDRLVEPVEPPVLLAPAQQPQRDALVVAELVEGYAEELGRAVGDQHADLTVEDAELQ